MMRGFACWLFIALAIVSGCTRAQITVSVTARAEWVNPLTDEKLQAVIRPLVRIQPADESEPPKTLQPFSGLKWKRWQAASDVALTIVVRDAARRLRGVEIEFGDGQRKFIPAQSRNQLKATMVGNLVRNEIIATIFADEGGRTVPKWKLLINPERRGRPVRFVFELPATLNEAQGLPLPPAVQKALKPDKDGFVAEFSVKIPPQSGMLTRTFSVQSWRWVNHLLPPPGLTNSPQNFATAEDKAVWDKWTGLFKEFPKTVFWQEKEQVHLTAFLEGKVTLRYEVTGQVWVEVSGDVAEDADVAAVRERLRKALASSAPIASLPRPETELSRKARETGKFPTREELLKAYRRWMEQVQERNKSLKDALETVAAPLGLANLSVRVLAEKFEIEPKRVERELKPITVALRLQLQGRANCDYHRLIHIVPVSGKVRFVPGAATERLPPFILEQKRRLWEGIPSEPIEVNVPAEGAEVKVPFAWLEPFMGMGVSVEVQARGWRLARPFKPGVWIVPPEQTSHFTFELEPTRAEAAAFLLDLTYDAQLHRATVVVQNEQGKVVASGRARWFEDYGGHGILLTDLPYGTYQVAAEGSYLLNGKRRNFSVHQTARVQSYHFVVWLKVD